MSPSARKSSPWVALLASANALALGGLFYLFLVYAFSANPGRDLFAAIGTIVLVLLAMVIPFKRPDLKSFLARRRRRKRLAKPRKQRSYFWPRKKTPPPLLGDPDRTSASSPLRNGLQSR